MKRLYELVRAGFVVKFYRQSGDDYVEVSKGGRAAVHPLHVYVPIEPALDWAVQELMK